MSLRITGTSDEVVYVNRVSPRSGSRLSTVFSEIRELFFGGESDSQYTHVILSWEGSEYLIRDNDTLESLKKKIRK